jgi:hypothetical protein
MFNPNIRGCINYYVRTTSRLSTRPSGTSTEFWRDGHIGSSSLYGGTGGGHGTGWIASRDANHACSPTGVCSRDAAEQ